MRVAYVKEQFNVFLYKSSMSPTDCTLCILLTNLLEILLNFFVRPMRALIKKSGLMGLLVRYHPSFFLFSGMKDLDLALDFMLSFHLVTTNLLESIDYIIIWVYKNDVKAMQTNGTTLLNKCQNKHFSEGQTFLIL